MALSLKKLSELNGVAGNEKVVREYIISLISDRCTKVDVDVMGNIIAFKKGRSSDKKIMLASNMDEAGFIVSEITDSGYLKFKPVGDIDPRTLVSKRVVIGDNGAKGVIGMKAIHLQKKSERESAVSVNSLFIDVGCSKKSNVSVSLGDYITFDTKFGENGDIIKGKALDRFGCACLIEAMDEEAAYDTYFVFSTQREQPGKICGRGLMTASYTINPDIALIVDTVSSGDVYKSEKHNISARLGSGAVIEYMDRTSIADTILTSKIKNIAVRENIGVQDKMTSTGRTITGAVLGAVCACVGIPCRYSHTPVCMMNKKDIDAVSKICRLFVKEREIADGITQ